MKQDVRLYVEDILESISRIEEYIKVIAKDDFYKNTQVQDAVLRRLEIIGEAIKNIPQEFKYKNPDIPWRKITGMRDVTTHEYFGVDMERVWKVVKEEIFDLRDRVLKIKGILSNNKVVQKEINASQNLEIDEPEIKL